MVSSSSSATSAVVQVLRQACQLEALQARLLQPTIHNLDLLASLPALRRLILTHGWRVSESLREASLSLARRALPHVYVLGSEDTADISCSDEFFAWADCV